MTMPSDNIRPTDSELTILQVLWDKGPSTVREVHEVLAKEKQAGYTTTLKLMQIMHAKGLVKRNTQSRSHVYEATVSREKTRGQLVDRMIKTLFQGSSSGLVMQALGHHQASPEELKEIRKYLEGLEKKG
jgi:predicted transcriptional regulator